jgi:hypothetical protein
MRLKSPDRTLYLIAFILAMASLVFRFLITGQLGAASYWFAFIAWLVLAIGALVRLR